MCKVKFRVPNCGPGPHGRRQRTMGWSDCYSSQKLGHISEVKAASARTYAIAKMGNSKLGSRNNGQSEAGKP